MLAYFQSLTRYNRWANERLYRAAAELSEDEFNADRGAFFRSMKGTLNHLVVTDRIWLHRITGEGPSGYALNDILFEDFASLRRAREEEDRRLSDVIAGMTDRRIGETLRYRASNGDEFAEPLTLVLGHVFNHQTHHRGQAHTILSGLGKDAPPLDLVRYMREVGAEAA